MITAALHKRKQTYLDLAILIRTDNTVSTIHDFRVASRNLLALEPLLRKGSDTSHWKIMMRKWLKTLNQVRDIQVLQEILVGHVEIEPLLLTHKRNCLKEWQEISRIIADKNFQDDLISSLETYCCRIEAEPAFFDQTVFSLWLKTFQKVQIALQHADHEHPISLHKLRLRYKSLRYLATFIYDVGIVDTLDFPRLKYWQDLLGSIQDLEVGINWLRNSRVASNLINELSLESIRLRIKYRDEKEKFGQNIMEMDNFIRSGIQNIKLNSQAVTKI